MARATGAYHHDDRRIGGHGKRLFRRGQTGEEMNSHLDVRLEGVTRTVWAVAAAIALSIGPDPASAAGASEISRDAQAALKNLYATVPAAKTVGAKAQAVLVFPKITKAGLGVGGQYGDGALIKGGKTVAYYNTSGLSTGLQAGAQQYGYAMFFMNDAALKQLDKSEGFEVGVGPSIVVMDDGKAKTTTTTTMKDDIYAFIFSQKGLMAGLGLQGNKITKINPK
jgi:lipid-binding SYLF domain-containing protein